MTISSKEELYALPITKTPGTDAEFVGQVFTCLVDAPGPEECPFIVIRPEKRALGTSRPSCDKHPNKVTSWCNLYRINGVLHVYHW